MFEDAPLPESVSTASHTAITHPEARGILLFYPGGLVSPLAYLPILGQLSQEAHITVLIPHMPLGLAVLDADRFELVKDATLPVFIGGHSLGGAMAVPMINTYPNQFKGLILWGAYPGKGDDISKSDVPVLSISGSRDGLSTPEEINEAKTRLPNTTTYAVIEGGNHAQFGHYGEQEGDQRATLSRGEQQEQVVAATATFIQKALLP